MGLIEQTERKIRFMPPAQWDQAIWHQQMVFKELASLFPLASLDDFPSLATLQDWLEQSQPKSPWQFVSDALLQSDGRYYEDFINATAQIPTRSRNWHDLFGALIWCLFPKTKQLLNELHQQELQTFGRLQRSPLRHKLTLLDETGIILCYTKNADEMVQLLQNHQWVDAFWHRREQWFQQQPKAQIGAMVFGHANYEMMTRPFIGLTGKMLALQVPDDFFAQTLRQRIDFVDTILSEQLHNSHLLMQKTQLTPLPLLGIPGWYTGAEQPEFYQDQHYFRPKNINKIRS